MLNKRVRRLFMASLAVVAPLAGATAIATVVAPVAAFAAPGCTGAVSLTNTDIYDQTNDDNQFLNANNTSTYTEDNGATVGSSGGLGTGDEWDVCEVATGEWWFWNVADSKYLNPGTSGNQLKANVASQNGQLYTFSVSCDGLTEGAQLDGYDSTSSAYDYGITSQNTLGGSGTNTGMYNDGSGATPSNFTIGGLCGASTETASNLGSENTISAAATFTDPNTSDYLWDDPSSTPTYSWLTTGTSVELATEFGVSENSVTGMTVFDDATLGQLAYPDTSNSDDYRFNAVAPSDYDVNLTCLSSTTFRMASPQSSLNGLGKAITDNSGHSQVVAAATGSPTVYKDSLSSVC